MIAVLLFDINVSVMVYIYIYVYIIYIYIVCSLVHNVIDPNDSFDELCVTILHCNKM